MPIVVVHVNRLGYLENEVIERRAVRFERSYDALTEIPLAEVRHRNVHAHMLERNILVEPVCDISGDERQHAIG